MAKKRIEYADDDVSSVKKLLILRTPSLFVGLILGLIMSFVISGFESVIRENIALAFFLPLVVYLADAIGTQTQTIYIRDLKTGKADFKKYLIKESFLGFAWGIVFSLISSIVIYFWFNSIVLAFAVGLSMFCAILVAPLIALVVTRIVSFYREDPAIASGPIATVIRDVLSVVLYGIISSAIIL
ncbi:MAG: magnesium transporter [Nanoarchaeota archaeon]|nr:magnesium transporter [Nanoarchaeota archaeon]